jgi:hypothetical protein
MTLCEQADPSHFGLQPNGRYLPGSAEIVRRCAEIQSRWSVAERIKRRAWAQPVPVMLKEFSVGESAMRLYGSRKPRAVGIG